MGKWGRDAGGHQASINQADAYITAHNSRTHAHAYMRVHTLTEVQPTTLCEIGATHITVIGDAVHTAVPLMSRMESP